MLGLAWGCSSCKAGLVFLLVWTKPVSSEIAYNIEMGVDQVHAFFHLLAPAQEHCYQEGVCYNDGLHRVVKAGRSARCAPSTSKQAHTCTYASLIL